MQFYKFDNADLGQIFIPKETDPQEYAMLAAMFSRSNNTVPDMVEKVNKNGPSSFMEKYMIGYGHESIGDLVDVKLFIQGIPLYLAPLIEHYALFRGQESSTRYIDFSKQDVYGKDVDLMRAQVQEYLKASSFVFDKLSEINKPNGEFQVNAVRARSFDITRSLLPLGIKTNVAWFGDIRGIKGHLAWMRDNHSWSQPWVECIYNALKTIYPASMEKDLAGIRPREPWVFEKGTCEVEFKGMMDFGSWRDLNRHRVGYQSFKLPRRSEEIYSWHSGLLDQLSYRQDIELYRQSIDSYDLGTLLLGFPVYFHYEMPWSQANYFCWRRSQMDVHPTLRLPVEELAVEYGLMGENGRKPDVGLGYIERRGQQTIFHKPENDS